MSKVASEGLHVSDNNLELGCRLQAGLRNLIDPHLRVFALAFSKGLHQVEQLLFMDQFFWAAQRVESLMPTALAETIFEVVRCERFPHRPSRLDCVFLFPRLSDAQRFIAEYRRGRGQIFRCRVASGQPFVADMALRNTLVNLEHPIEDELSRMQERAERYWTGGSPDEMEWPEILVIGDVTVVEGPLKAS